MTEMNAVNTGGNNDEPSGGTGFFEKFFDKNTIIAFVVVLIMGFINYKLIGFWGLVIFVVLGPVGATLGNIIRLWVMPDGIFTFEGFWGLVKVKLFWAFGPQFIGALLCLGIAGGITQNGREKQSIKMAEK